MKSKYLLIILGMMAVTYLPRLLPFLFVSKDNKTGWFNRFLRFIPYTALGALIIPGVIDSIPQMPIAGIVGISFAFVYSWFRRNVIVSVLGAVFISYIMILAGRMI
ncbi:MAG: AzlD domain-containing protein [Bacillota bacterium]|nr:AzlD domain-containing protein [Bacillota bacterium]